MRASWRVMNAGEKTGLAVLPRSFEALDEVGAVGQSHPSSNQSLVVDYMLAAIRDHRPDVAFELGEKFLRSLETLRHTRQNDVLDQIVHTETPKAKSEASAEEGRARRREQDRARLFDTARPETILGPANVVAVYRALGVDGSLGLDDVETVAQIYYELADGIAAVPRLLEYAAGTKAAGQAPDDFVDHFAGVSNTATLLLMHAVRLGPDMWKLILQCPLKGACRKGAPFYVNRRCGRCVLLRDRRDAALAAPAPARGPAEESHRLRSNRADEHMGSALSLQCTRTGRSERWRRRTPVKKPRRSAPK